MSHWNYRLMRHKEDGEEYLEMHEVHYNDNGQVTSWAEKAVSPFSENKDGMVWVLDKMKEATKKPILEYDMQPEGERE